MKLIRINIKYYIIMFRVLLQATDYSFIHLIYALLQFFSFV